MVYLGGHFKVWDVGRNVSNYFVCPLPRINGLLFWPWQLCLLSIFLEASCSWLLLDERRYRPCSPAVPFLHSLEPPSSYNMVLSIHRTYRNSWFDWYTLFSISIPLPIILIGCGREFSIVNILKIFYLLFLQELYSTLLVLTQSARGILHSVIISSCFYTKYLKRRCSIYLNNYDKY